MSDETRCYGSHLSWRTTETGKGPKLEKTGEACPGCVDCKAERSAESNSRLRRSGRYGGRTS